MTVGSPNVIEIKLDRLAQQAFLMGNQLAAVSTATIKASQSGR